LALMFTRPTLMSLAQTPQIGQQFNDLGVAAGACRPGGSHVAPSAGAPAARPPSACPRGHIRVAGGHRRRRCRTSWIVRS
jgi:hypothetical protein